MLVRAAPVPMRTRWVRTFAQAAFAPPASHRLNAVGGGRQVALLGSGNFGSAMAKVIGSNVSAQGFDPHVPMYVHEEVVNGRKLTETINATRENVRYLPGVHLPETIWATPSPEEAVKHADLLVFVLPHQYVRRLCEQIKPHTKPGARAISLIKGLDVWGGEMKVFPQVISAELNVGACLSLSGANIASEIAQGKYAETTIGFPPEDQRVAETFQALFSTASFPVQLVPDVDGVALCGALKNIVALAAGFSDGMKAGDNTKAALLRRGLLELQEFGREFVPSWRDETLLSSAGVGDLLTTCYGGRNRRVAEAFVSSPHGFDVLEQELLGGQKLQGVQTATEVHQFLLARGRTKAYPLFNAVYQIAMEGRPVSSLLRDL